MVSKAGMTRHQQYFRWLPWVALFAATLEEQMLTLRIGQREIFDRLVFEIHEGFMTNVFSEHIGVD